MILGNLDDFICIDLISESHTRSSVKIKCSKIMSNCDSFFFFLLLREAQQLRDPKGVGNIGKLVGTHPVLGSLRERVGWGDLRTASHCFWWWWETAGLGSVAGA